MKKILTVVLASLMLAAGANAAFERVNTYSDDFSDVTEKNWFYDNVKTAYELGFMNGKSEDKFDPNGNVTVVEGITMASRLHAMFYGTEVTKSDEDIEYRLDFDNPKILSAVQNNTQKKTESITLGRATGEISDGILVVQADKPNQYGSYNPQIKVTGIELEANKYNKIAFRMKVEPLEDKNPRNNSVGFFFQTSVEGAIAADKQIYIPFPKGIDYTEWFTVEAELGNHAKWQDVITGFRFDPSNNNGIYHVDYIVFSKSENIKNEKWYDMYVDYASENGIIEKIQYKDSDFSRNITRAEICNLFAKAIPEEHFEAVNDIKGIPDVLRDSENADVYLTLYKAGILLGADEEGNLRPDADIKRSEIAAIINRVALPENRVRGTIECDWAEQGNECDVEFNDQESLGQVSIYKAEYAEIVNGALVLRSQFMGEAASPQYDPQISVNNVSINAEDYTKLRVRMKAEFIGEPLNQVSKQFDFYFSTDADSNFTQAKSIHKYHADAGYVDAFGWYIIDVDFRSHGDWKGNITGFRFDPATADGIFTIDYIRLVKSDPLFNATHEELVSHGYKATYLMQDNGWENGFYVSHFEQQKLDKEQRIWKYNDTDEKPMWDIGPWWCLYDLWENRVEGDKYVLTDDKGINTVIYNPEEKSVTMRVNATKIYEGKPHDPNTYKWWPHLLLDQGYKSFAFDKVKNTIDVDRTYLELDIRVLDFKDTINREGRNSCSFLAYFYLLSDKDPSSFIYYGLHLFLGTSSSTNTVPTWAPDSAGHKYMYGIPAAVVYGGIENSFTPEQGKVVAGEQWKHVRVDITEHLDRCIEWANRDNAFGVKVSREDMYFGGGNIGFEIHGNYDCTVEIKNVNIVSYNKAD